MEISNWNYIQSTEMKMDRHNSVVNWNALRLVTDAHHTNSYKYLAIEQFGPFWFMWIMNECDVH